MAAQKLKIVFAISAPAVASNSRGVVHPWVGQIRLKRNGFKTLFKSEPGVHHTTLKSRDELGIHK